MTVAGMNDRGAAMVRRFASALGRVGLTGGAVAAVGAVGAVGGVKSMREAYPRPRRGPDGARLPAEPRPDNAVTVAVVLGASGSVVADALLPYEVFARSPNFSVYTVSDEVAATLSGGLVVLPDYSLEDVDDGVAPEPDVVVVPAVTAPAGTKEAPLREWIVRREAAGARILGVCAGSAVLAAAGVLDGRRATSHWSKIAGLQRRHPTVRWVRGQRYVEDGTVTTTAGVTSGVFGALRLVELLAGAAEAQRVGRDLAYPGWRLDDSLDIPARRWAPRDIAYLLTMVFPWFRPLAGVGLIEGVGEIDAAAPFELYANSFAAHTLPVAAEPVVTTRHGLHLAATPAARGALHVDRLIVPGARSADVVDPRLAKWAADESLEIDLPHSRQADGEFSFDPLLRDLAAHTDRTTAHAAAKQTEYPTDHLQLNGTAWPRRPTALIAAALGVGLLPRTVARRFRR
jgi:putative intracellular protease/amidase